MRRFVSDLVSVAFGPMIALVASACGGSSSVVAPPDAVRLEGPSAAEVNVAYSIATTPENGDAPPRSTVEIVLSGNDGQVVRATVAEYPAECIVLDVPEGSDVLTARCWWAGAGLSIHALHEGDEVVVRKLQIYEEAAENMADAIETHRFALAAGARVYETPAH